MVLIIVLAILTVVLIGTLPRWPYSVNWGYAPSGVITLLVVVVGLLALTGWL